jgi:hypothetical protein
MRINIVLLSIFVSFNSFCQTGKTVFTEKDFDTQILNFTPINLGITDQNFQDALSILEQSKDRIIQNNKQYDYLDYWNIMVIFNRLHESEHNLDVAFNKFHKAEGSCEYLTSLVFQKNFNNFPSHISKKLWQAASECPTTIEKEFDLEEYLNNNKFDRKLVTLISQIEERDLRYRFEKTIPEKQKRLDESNQQKIDSLYEIHQQYIGKSLVGEYFENVMWEVIQHSNVKYMEKYLPVIHEAVVKKDISQVPLKYLLDRIANEKSGVQYFGSQDGVPMADQKSIDAMKKQYNIE